MSNSGEEITFEIVLSGTYWMKPPEFDILLDDEVIHSDIIVAPSSSKGLPVEHKMEDDYAESTLQTHKFTKNLAPGEHVLGVRLKNKTAEDTRRFNADGNYALDMLLNIEAIKIDGVDLQQLIHDESEYILDNEHQGTSKLTRCTSLGHNGTYRLKITSPFYIWLLERL